MLALPAYGVRPPPILVEHSGEIAPDTTKLEYAAFDPPVIAGTEIAPSASMTTLGSFTP
jgi:hypothetical protein